MDNHTVHIDSTKYPGTINFSDIFNVAVHMIDRHSREGRASKTVIHCVDGSEVSYSQLEQRVNQCGNYLKDLGLSEGDRILIVAKDCAEFLYLFWGAIKVGIVPIPINTILRAKDYFIFIEDSQCKGLFYSANYSAEVLPAAEQISSQSMITICIDGSADTENSLSSLINEYPSHLDAYPSSADDDCFILYSSGTTGKPKGAVHSHKNLITTCFRFAEQTLNFTENDIIYSAAKLFFAYGLGGANNFVLWAGASVILDPQRPTPETIINLIETHRPTVFFGVPTLYAGILQILSIKHQQLDSLRLCTSAGEALPAQLFIQWQKLTGLKLLDGIGSTENLSHFLCNTIGNERPSSSGVELPGYQAKIVDENDDEVPLNTVGQLIIHGDSMANRYWGNPDKSATTMVDDWLYTGDSYLKDDQGFYYCQGRDDDMLKVGGIWCSPLEIEEKLFEHSMVLEAAVVGALDNNELIKPKAFVVTKEKVVNIKEFKEELKSLCKKSLAPYKYPRWFEIIDELPKTATGKVQRFRLRSGGSLSS